MKLRTDLVPVALEFIVMRHRPSRQYVKPFFPPKPTEPVIEQPITTKFTPAQTMVLLTLRNSELALAVLVKLNHGTARPTEQAKEELRALGLATIERDGKLQLTPHGHFTANQLARALAEQLGVSIPTFKPEQRRHDGYRRSGFARGVFSQSGNW